MPWFMSVSHKLVKKICKSKSTSHWAQNPEATPECVGVDTSDTSLTSPTAEGKSARPASLQATPCWQGEWCSLNIPHFYLHSDKSQNKSAGISAEY